MTTPIDAPAPVAEPPKTVNDTLYPPKVAEPEPPKKIDEPAPEPPKDAAEPPKEPEPKEPSKEEPKAPEKYTFKAPEGVTLDEAQVSRFSEVGKKLNLTQDAAQALFDLHVAEVQAGATAGAEAQKKAWETIQGEWKAELAKDPVLGGQQKAVETRIGKLIDEYGNKEVRAAFDLTGAGNHPAITRFMNKIAEQLVEGGPLPQGKPASKKGGSLAERLGYNNQN